MSGEQLQQVVDGLIGRLAEIEQVAGPVDRALQALDYLAELRASAGDRAAAASDRFVEAYLERFGS